MAEFNGFTCDECGKIIEAKDRTAEILRYEGLVIEGEKRRDLCPQCAPDPRDVSLVPLRKKKPPAKSEPEVASPG